MFLYALLIFSVCRITLKNHANRFFQKVGRPSPREQQPAEPDCHGGYRGEGYDSVYSVILSYLLFIHVSTRPDPVGRLIGWCIVCHADLHPMLLHT